MSAITTTKRDPKAKGKHLRRMGITPCSIYGGALPASISAQITRADAEKLARENMIGNKVELELEGNKIPVLIKDIARNAISREIEHLGFQALDALTKINGVAHIILLNRDLVPAFISQSLFEVPYTALPADIVETITIDLEGMTAGTHISVNDLEIAKNKNVELLIDSATGVLSIEDAKHGAKDGDGTPGDGAAAE